MPLDYQTHGVIALCPIGSRVVMGRCNIDGIAVQKWYDDNGPLSDLSGWYCEAGAYTNADVLRVTAYCASGVY